MMEIKKLKSGLKAADSELQSKSPEIMDFKTMGSDFIIKQLEENIKFREMPLEKKAFKTLK